MTVDMRTPISPGQVSGNHGQLFHTRTSPFDEVVSFISVVTNLFFSYDKRTNITGKKQNLVHQYRRTGWHRHMFKKRIRCTCSSFVFSLATSTTVTVTSPPQSKNLIGRVRKKQACCTCVTHLWISPCRPLQFFLCSPLRSCLRLQKKSYWMECENLTSTVFRNSGDAILCWYCVRTREELCWTTCRTCSTIIFLYSTSQSEKSTLFPSTL